jgi:hypothetical protein
MSRFRRLSFPLTTLGLILLAIATTYALKTRSNIVLAVIALLLLPTWVMLLLRLLLKVPSFVSAQIAFGLALLSFAFVTPTDFRLPYLQDALLLLFIFPVCAVYAVASVPYLLIKENYNPSRAILPVILVVVAIITSFKWWFLSETYPIFDAGVLVVYLWFSLVSVIYLALRRKRGIRVSVLPLLINLVSLGGIWIVATLVRPQEYYYRYLWRREDLNVVVQRIEAGEIRPGIYREISLPDRYLYLAYDGWVRAETNDSTWAIYFYDSPFSGYLYRTDGQPIDALDCGAMKRINENWFYCHP